MLTAWFVQAAYGLVGDPTRLSIIALHSIRREPDPLFPGELDAAAFEDLVMHLARCYRVMRLGDAVDALRKGILPPRALSITFDDGYADNAAIALPILRRHHLPATFFVATGFLDGGLMWNDAVIECVRRCELPVVDLVSFGLGELALDTPAQRRDVIEALLPRVKYQTLDEREALLARLHTACGAPTLPRTLMMSSAQVSELAAAGMEIGAHTVRHPILACETLEAVEREIADSRERLRGLSDQPVDSFAFPNGQPGKDYRPEHVQLLRSLGFRCAVSTRRGIAARDDDPLQLPRFTPWDRAPLRWSMRLLGAQRQGGAAS